MMNQLELEPPPGRGPGPLRVCKRKRQHPEDTTSNAGVDDGTTSEGTLARRYHNESYRERESKTAVKPDEDTKIVFGDLQAKACAQLKGWENLPADLFGLIRDQLSSIDLRSMFFTCTSWNRLLAQDLSLTFHPTMAIQRKVFGAPLKLYEKTGVHIRNMMNQNSVLVGSSQIYLISLSSELVLSIKDELWERSLELPSLRPLLVDSINYMHGLLRRKENACFIRIATMNADEHGNPIRIAWIPAAPKGVFYTWRVSQREWTKHTWEVQSVHDIALYGNWIVCVENNNRLYVSDLDSGEASTSKQLQRLLGTSPAYIAQFEGTLLLIGKLITGSYKFCTLQISCARRQKLVINTTQIAGLSVFLSRGGSFVQRTEDNAIQIYFDDTTVSSVRDKMNRWTHRSQTTLKVFCEGKISHMLTIDNGPSRPIDESGTSRFWMRRGELKEKCKSKLK